MFFSSFIIIVLLRSFIYTKLCGLNKCILLSLLLSTESDSEGFFKSACGWQVRGLKSHFCGLKNPLYLNPIALRKAKIVHNFGLSEGNMVNRSMSYFAWCLYDYHKLHIGFHNRIGYMYMHNT